MVKKETMKHSKQLGSRKRLWGYYVKNNKGFKSFEDYCGAFIDTINKLNARGK